MAKRYKVTRANKFVQMFGMQAIQNFVDKVGDLPANRFEVEQFLEGMRREQKLRGLFVTRKS